jgi:hypothetical protein
VLKKFALHELFARMRDRTTRAIPGMGHPYGASKFATMPSGRVAHMMAVSGRYSNTYLVIQHAYMYVSVNKNPLITLKISY